MDEDRRIRMLVAPILFVASLLWGDWFTSSALILPKLKVNDLQAAFNVIAGGGVVVFTAGYVIGTMTHFILRLSFWWAPACCVKSRYYEAAVSDETLQSIWGQLGASGNFDRRLELSAVASFDHGLVREKYEGIHRWLLRRWNAFSIAATSSLGLALSLIFGAAIGIPWDRRWWLPVAAFAALLIPVMVWNWRDTMRMIDFAASLPLNKPKAPPKAAKRASGGEVGEMG